MLWVKDLKVTLKNISYTGPVREDRDTPCCPLPLNEALN